MPEIPIESITGLGVAALAVWLFYKYASNHAKDVTKAIKGLTVVIQELKDVIKDKL